MRCGRLVAVAILLGLGACVSGSVDPLPPPPTTQRTTSTTAAPDHSETELGGVPGTTSTTVPVVGGKASMKGTVTAPDGSPVAGAVVLIERMVGDGVGATRTVTAADGTWTHTGLHGGRYRVRAWLAPELALVEPVQMFLEAADKRDVPIRLARYSGLGAVAAVAPSPPIVGESTQLVVQAVSRTVDGEGVVHGSPVAGVRMELVGSGSWRLETESTVTADGRGEGSWVLRCGATGRQPLSVVIAGEEAESLDIPDCTTQPPPTSAGPGPSGSGTTTTTTSPRRGGSTTTTRRSTTTTTED